ncbi:MAG: response regulator [Gemmataceae bacterium]
MCLHPRPRRPGVLIVDGKPLVRGLLAALLTMEGFTPYRAGSAEDAVTVLRERAGEIDAALIDLETPGDGGLELRRRLAGLKPGLRCGLMGRMRVSDATLPEGFRHALDKPFTLAQLRACLDSLRPAGA